MKCEFERRFLLKDDGWKKSVTHVRYLRDGLIAGTGSRKVRVRIEGTSAWLTVKGPRSGIGRLEFEYEIPVSHAEALMSDVCDGDVVEKTRYLVPHDGRVWEIDVYEGALQGVTYAEVELTSQDQPLSLPNWAGEEVTANPQHSKRALVAAFRAKATKENSHGDANDCPLPVNIG